MNICKRYHLIIESIEDCEDNDNGTNTLRRLDYYNFTSFYFPKTFYFGNFSGLNQNHNILHFCFNVFLNLLSFALFLSRNSSLLKFLLNNASVMQWLMCLIIELMWILNWNTQLLNKFWKRNAFKNIIEVITFHVSELVYCFIFIPCKRFISKNISSLNDGRISYFHIEY